MLKPNMALVGDTIEEVELVDPPSPDENDTSLKPKRFPTLFGNIHEKSVTFCIDTSGSMYNKLDAIKEHLIETLINHVEQGLTFNIIEFDSDVVPWSDSRVLCTHETVDIATSWIKKLQAKTGTNVLDALLMALGDGACEAVYLVTDGHPDQHPTDILDQVAVVAENRPIHCYYIKGDIPDPPAEEFLQQLAVETYGSYHVISVTQHGTIERVTAVYRADAGLNRIIRTTSGNIYSANTKECTVTTTLDSPLHEVTIEPPIIMEHTGVYPYHHFYPSYVTYYPYHCNFFFHPSYGWSRYKPASSWMKTTERIMEASQDLPYAAPGPGALLIGQPVLARRHEDGIYYLGNVKSQILEEKFLVEFGPCKHGKFRETTYQETNIYDIISHTDALRHSVLVGDKVLAPWEPEGERFGPGVVIDGQEKRDSQGTYQEKTLTVSFFNGKTVDVPYNTAVWIPPDLHDRVTFELRLPANARTELILNQRYPEETLPGYPASGTLAYPAEYERFEPIFIEEKLRPYRHYVPMGRDSRQMLRSCMKNGQLDHVIPGTKITKEELNKRVMSQIMEHKILLEGQNHSGFIHDNMYGERLLRKREMMEEKSILRREKNFDKAVSFEDQDRYEDEMIDGDFRDSGRGSATDLLSDLELDDYDNSDDKDFATRDANVGTDSPLFYKRKSRTKTPKKPAWRYWKNDPAPSLLEPKHFGPYRVGPYEDGGPAVHVENKKNTQGPNGVEWPGAMSQFVDPYSSYKCDTRVNDTMFAPRPPSGKPEKQGPGIDISIKLGAHQKEKEKIAEARKDYRRRRVIERQIDLADQRDDKSRTRELMEDQHRQQIISRIEHQHERQKQEWDLVQRQREAKKAISAEIRARIEENQQREQSRDEQRISALRAKREHREAVQEQRQKEIIETKERRQAIKEQNLRARQSAIKERVAEKSFQEALQQQHKQNLKIQRIEHFRQKEEKAQKHKLAKAQIKEQNLNVWRSQVLP